MNLKTFFNPKSVAVIGASGEAGKVGNVIAKNLLELGYKGKVFLINPNHEKLLGKRCYKNVLEVKENIDLAIVAIPAKFILPVISESAKKVNPRTNLPADRQGKHTEYSGAGIKNWVIISSGFSEIGEEGIKKEEALKKIAQDKNLNILGPNCLGFIVPKLKLNASFAGGMPEEGGIALISQSGALAVAMMDAAKERAMKFSKIISIGNKMTLSETELLEYLGQDKDTKVIGMYLEGIEKGSQFIKTAQEVSKKKPVIVLKAGKTEEAQEAISSHTGALAGDTEVARAVFKKAGILETDILESFFNLLSLASLVKNPLNSNEVVIVTNAGGPGVLATDAFKDKTIKLAEINLEIKKKLKSFLPKEASVENPIDLLGDARKDRYEKTLEIIDKHSKAGAIICILTPQEQTPVEKIADSLINFKKRTDKLVVAVFIGGDKVEKAIQKLKENKIASFSFPESAVEALEAFYNWIAAKKSEPFKIKSETKNKDRLKTAAGIISRAKSENRKALYFSEAQEIMKAYNINTINCLDINAVGDFPVALKVDSDKILHKTDKKGLVLGIKNKKEFEEALTKMRRNFPDEKLIVQPMLERKVELILGIKNDPTFGPVLVYGLGGIYAEVFKMVDFLILPLNLEEIRDNLMGSKIGFLFKKTRGQNPYNINEIAQIILHVSQLAEDLDEIKELDINPLLVYNDRKSAMAVDIKIII